MKINAPFFKMLNPSRILIPNYVLYLVDENKNFVESRVDQFRIKEAGTINISIE